MAIKSIKDLSIKTCDALVYIMFAFVFLSAGLAALGGQVWNSIIFLIVGVIVCSVLSGFWLAISKISEESEKQTELLRKILNKEF